jgi:hypothetical protein
VAERDDACRIRQSRASEEHVPGGAAAFLDESKKFFDTTRLMSSFIVVVSSWISRMRQWLSSESNSFARTRPLPGTTTVMSMSESTRSWPAVGMRGCTTRDEMR